MNTQSGTQLVAEVVLVTTLRGLARLVINVFDQITVKGVYTDEANRELEEFKLHNKQNFIDVGCTPLRPICSDVYSTVFALTRVLSNTKITPTENIKYG